MTAHGYFDSSPVPAPYVQMWVHLPRLNATVPVDFLLDTGADTTSLHRDAANSLRMHSLAFPQGRVTVRGVGGPVSYIQEDAFVFLQDGTTGGWHYFSVTIDLASPGEDHAADGLPSLLGRDILNRCRYTIDAEQRSVTIVPRHTDERSGFFALPTQ